jgi:tetratricopeptide (TPR) repeat protein
MRLLTSASGQNAKTGLAWLLTLVSLSLPLSLLTGCGEPPATTGGDNAATGGKAGKGTDTSKAGESDYVTDDEIAKYVNGTPDHSVKFPEDAFVKGRQDMLALKFSDSEKILRDGLNDAVKSSSGEIKLGQYCIRFCNTLYQEKKYKEAIKYAILASKIFYKQPPEQRPVPMWFFNDHMHLGLCYKNLGNNAEAEAQLRKAINVAASAPSGQIDWRFHRMCYIELIATLENDHKQKLIKAVKDDMKALEDKHK